MVATPLVMENFMECTSKIPVSTCKELLRAHVQESTNNPKAIVKNSGQILDANQGISRIVDVEKVCVDWEDVLLPAGPSTRVGKIILDLLQQGRIRQIDIPQKITTVTADKDGIPVPPVPAPPRPAQPPWRVAPEGAPPRGPIAYPPLPDGSIDPRVIDPLLRSEPAPPAPPPENLYNGQHNVTILIEIQNVNEGLGTYAVHANEVFVRRSVFDFDTTQLITKLQAALGPSQLVSRRVFVSMQDQSKHDEEIAAVDEHGMCSSAGREMIELLALGYQQAYDLVAAGMIPDQRLWLENTGRDLPAQLYSTLVLYAKLASSSAKRALTPGPGTLPAAKKIPRTSRTPGPGSNVSISIDIAPLQGSTAAAKTKPRARNVELDHSRMHKLLADIFDKHSLTTSMRASSEALKQSKLLTKAQRQQQKKTSSAPAIRAKNASVPVSQLLREAKFVYALLHPPTEDRHIYHITASSIPHSIVADFLDRGETWVGHASRVFIWGLAYGPLGPRAQAAVETTFEAGELHGMGAMHTYLRGVHEKWESAYLEQTESDAPALRLYPFRFHGGNYAVEEGQESGDEALTYEVKWMEEDVEEEDED